MLVFSTDLIVYLSAIYPHWKTFKYGLGGRLGQIIFCEIIVKEVVIITQTMSTSSIQVLFLNTLQIETALQRESPGLNWLPLNALKEFLYKLFYGSKILLTISLAMRKIL